MRPCRPSEMTGCVANSRGRSSSSSVSESTSTRAGRQSGFCCTCRSKFLKVAPQQSQTSQTSQIAPPLASTDIWRLAFRGDLKRNGTFKRNGNINKSLPLSAFELCLRLRHHGCVLRRGAGSR